MSKRHYLMRQESWAKLERLRRRLLPEETEEKVVALKRLQRWLVSVNKHGCWVWGGNRLPSGYGLTRFRKKNAYAHRVSYELFFGKPKGFVLHKCDNPPCFNPWHLWVGSQADNVRDCIAKGRARNGDQRGEKNGRAILSATQVLNIRHRLKRGDERKRIARNYNVGRHVIDCIAKGVTWQSVK